GTPCPAGRLVLQVPAQELLEGDTVTLRCRRVPPMEVTQVQFYHEWKYLEGSHKGSELSLSPLQLHHSGNYRCGDRVSSGLSPWLEVSAPVTVTVHGEQPHTQH
ncbi:FCGR2 protein, partial [Grallaria varia]|nr:FCGR2 protein [Grallaria varia]